MTRNVTGPWRWAVMALLGVACAWAVACQQASPSTEAPAKRAPQVKAWKVTPGDAEVRRSYLVTLLAGEQAEVVSRASGYVLSWDVDRGGRVAKGQRLARVERGELTEQSNQAVANLAAAQAQLEHSLDNQRRARALAASRFIAQAEVDAAATAVRVAQAQVNAARAALDLTRTHAGYADVLAPFDGYVLRRAVEVGTLVGPQGPALFTLGSIERIRAEAAVPQQDVPHLVAGAPVALAVDGFPGEEFPGAITRFAPVLDPLTRTMQVELQFDNPGERLKPGMFGRASLVVDRLQAVLMLPPRALTRRDGHGSGFVVRDGKAAAVALTLGRTLPDGRVEVLKGLAAGDLLIVEGRDLVRDGLAVDVAEVP